MLAAETRAAAFALFHPPAALPIHANSCSRTRSGALRAGDWLKRPATAMQVRRIMGASGVTKRCFARFFEPVDSFLRPVLAVRGCTSAAHTGQETERLIVTMQIRTNQSYAVEVGRNG
jgi:hypothetical protein